MTTSPKDEPEVIIAKFKAIFEKSPDYLKIEVACVMITQVLTKANLAPEIKADISKSANLMLRYMHFMECNRRTRNIYQKLQVGPAALSILNTIDHKVTAQFTEECERLCLFLETFKKELS